MAQISDQKKQLHLQSWKDSGLTQREYSEKAGIPSSSLRGWIKQAKAEFTPHFIELFNHSALDKESDPEPVGKNQYVELAFPSGLILKIHG